MRQTKTISNKSDNSAMRKIQWAVFILSLVCIEYCQGCFTIDKDPNVPCVFPFTYQGTTYSECTNTTDQNGKRWCATKVDENGFHRKEWGYCAPDCQDRDFDIDIRTGDKKIYESDKQCGNAKTCKYQTDCPEFLEQKEYLQSLPKNSLGYRETLEQIKKSVCNRSDKRVCCPNPKQTEEDKCGRGISCVKEDQCKYTQDLRKKFQNGDNVAKQELIGLICDQKERKFCCPHSDVPKQDPQLDVPKQDPSWLPGKGDCGMNPDISPTKVVGGVDTRPGMFPFTALMGYPEKERKWFNNIRKFRILDTIKYKCGGTLINHWYVITAAHCQGTSENSKISIVRLGEWEVARDPDCNDQEECLNPVQDFEITNDQVIVHKNYRKSVSNVENDIALIRLPRPAVLNSGVQIVCLPINPAEAARELNLPNIRDGLTGKFPNVVGWGYKEYDPWVLEAQGDFATANVASSVQQRLGVKVLSSSECTQKFRQFKPDMTQICAGGDKGKDSCKGDSGGPLYLSKVEQSGYPTLDGTEPWYLIGVVSFGSRQCGSGKPGAYSRVEHFLPWIKKQIGNN